MCVAVCCSVLQFFSFPLTIEKQRVQRKSCVLQCVAVCCSSFLSLSPLKSNECKESASRHTFTLCDTLCALDSLSHLVTHFTHFTYFQVSHDTLPHLYAQSVSRTFVLRREVGGWGRDPKKCTRRGWGMGSSTI